MNLRVFKDDVPLSNFGFDFQLGDVKKDELLGVIKEKALKLCEVVVYSIPTGVRVELESVTLVSEDRAVLSIRVNDEREKLEIDI